MEAIHLRDLKAKPMSELVQMAKEFNIENAAGETKPKLIRALLDAFAAKKCEVFADGVLEVIDSGGFGFLRAPEYNYLPSKADDIYVAPSQIRRFGLRTGNVVYGAIRPPREGEQYFALLKVEKVNNETPETAREKILFENLTPLYPQQRYKLENNKKNFLPASSTCSFRSVRGSAV